MALPLIIKAAALGGAAYFASRWWTAQNRQRCARGGATADATNSATVQATDEATERRSQLAADSNRLTPLAAPVAREGLGGSAASPFPTTGTMA